MPCSMTRQRKERVQTARCLAILHGKHIAPRKSKMLFGVTHSIGSSPSKKQDAFRIVGVRKSQSSVLTKQQDGLQNYTGHANSASTHLKRIHLMRSCRVHFGQMLFIYPSLLSQKRRREYKYMMTEESEGFSHGYGTTDVNWQSWARS